MNLSAPLSTGVQALETDPDQLSIPCLFMRGGSSRGGFFLDGDLPQDPDERAAVLLACYGSPDARQINGIGGADALTSKAAVIRRSDRDDADLEYTFYQVGIDRAKVSTGGNCGNMLAAVAPFGLLRGLIKCDGPDMSVRIFTTNTGQVVTARMNVTDGWPRVSGNATVAGVPGTGSAIAIDFGNCAGSVSGTLLPTGNVRDRIHVGGKGIEVSFVDAATPFVFVNAPDIGAEGTELPSDLLAKQPVMAALEAIRGWAASVLGLVGAPADARRVTPNIPRVIMVSPPKSYRSTEGEVSEAEIDLCVRQLAMQKPHNTLAVTGSVCTAVASHIPGTIVHAVSRGTGERSRLGHPAGVLGVSAHIGERDGDFTVESAAVERTARLIMAGTLFVPRDRVAHVKSIMERDDSRSAKPASHD